MDTEILSEGELDARLQRSNPVNAAALDNESVDAALASVLRDASSEPQKTPSRSAGRPLYRRRWATLSAAAALTAVASLTGVETLAGGAGGAALTLAVAPAAAAQLTRVAHAAAAQPTPGAGQFNYLEYELETTADPTFGGETVDYTYTQTMQSWDRTVGDWSRQRETGDGISFASPQDRANYLANKAAFDAYFQRYVTDSTGAGPGGAPYLNDSVFPPHPSGIHPAPAGTEAAIANEVALGTEQPDGPQALLTDLTDSLDGEPADLWGGIMTILRSSANAKLRETAYEALAYVPGTTVLGNLKDQLGRAGIAIRFTDYVNGPTDTMIVDPSTGYMLEVDTSTRNSAGTIVQREIDLDRGIVDSYTALPGGGSQPITAATQTVNAETGQSTPTLGTTDSQSTTSTPVTTTTGSQSTTATPATTTAGSQRTSSTAGTTTGSQGTTSTADTTTTAGSQDAASTPQSS